MFLYLILKLKGNLFELILLNVKLIFLGSGWFLGFGFIGFGIKVKVFCYGLGGKLLNGLLVMK